MMTTTLYILCALLLASSVALAALLASARRRQAAMERRTAAAEAGLDQMTEREGRLAAEAEARNNRIAELAGELGREKARNESLTGQIERDRESLEQMKASLRIEFQNLAGEMMEDKSARFKELNKQEMELLLKPFRENITEFRQRVEKIYSEDVHRQGALQAELKNLFDLNRRITEETNALTNALKGNSKVQGDWGETILLTILENSSLIKGQHYTVQENVKDAEGNNLRPDVILNLPGGRRIVIDSKVSLTAYVGYSSAEGGAAQERMMKEHLASVRKHVSDLGSKNYQDQVLGSPDFVVMFVSNEPAFLCAMQNDPSIWSDAYAKKVIVSSPTNLFGMLKIVDDMWKRDDQSRNALEIAERGGRLYDKFVGFVESLEAIGKSLRSAQSSYDQAYGQLTEGSGNLVGQAEKLRKLGVKASKAMSAGALSAATAEEDEE